MNKLIKPYQDLLYLVRYALNKNCKNEKWSFSTSVSTLFSLAKFHSIEAMLYNVVKEIFTEEKDKIEVEKWRLEYNKIVHRYFLFEKEREEILLEFEKQKIWHVLLKGMVLKKYYPEPYYRQMADNDILFDFKKCLELKEIMKSRGYKIGKYVGIYDYMYHKPPFYNFEMHFKLSVYEDIKEYFEKVENRLISSKGKYEKELSEIDFYVYVLSHELKHYKNAGTGIRGLIDLYYYLKNRSSFIDFSKLHKILDEFGIAEFDRDRTFLVKNLFEKDISNFKSTFENEMLINYCVSGTYGTLEQAIERDIKKLDSTFIKYYFRKIFYINKILEYYPVVKKYKILIPFFMIYRLIKAPFKIKNWKELKIVFKKLILK